MNKLFLSAVFAFLISFSTHASASAITDSIQAAIDAGNFEQVNTIAAANPTAQGEIGMYLLKQSQAKFLGDPSLASKIFRAAVPFASQIPSQSAEAANIIRSVVDMANRMGCDFADPQAVTTVISAALNMSKQPNIAAAIEGLHVTVMAAANTCLEKRADAELQEQVSLAQTQNIAPTTGPGGAIVPSAE